MSLEKKFSQLKNSDELSVNKDWEKTTKYELLSEIHSQNRLMKAQQLSSAEKFDLFAMKAARRLMPSATKVIAGFLIIMLGSGTALAAQASVPGQPLWPVKRSIEKAELTLAVNPITETKVHIKHINKRLVEIDKLVGHTNNEQTPEKAAKNTKSIKQVVRHLEKDVAGVDTSLKIVKEEKEISETVDLVKQVKDVNKETKKKVVSLEEEVDISDENKANQQELKNVLDDVRDISDGVTKTIVNLAAEIHQEAVAQENDETTLESEQNDIQAVKEAVVEIINEEIDELSGEIQDSKDKKVKQAEMQVEENTDLVKQELLTAEKSEDAQVVLLGEAKVLLDEGLVKDAVDKVLASKEVNKKAGDDIRQLQDDSSKGINQPKTVTSTTEIINIDPAVVEEGIELEPAVVNEEAVISESVEIKDPEAELAN